MIEHGISTLEHSVPIDSTQRVWKYLAIHDEPRKADAIFLVGSSSLKPVLKSAALFHEGFAPKIAFLAKDGTFSGAQQWGMTETEKYRQILAEMNVPSDAIVFQDDVTKQALNTKEEALRMKGLLQRHNIDPKAVILVARPIHQRRALATFMQANEGTDFINCPANEELDITSLQELKRLEQEIERLLDYGVKKDDLKRQEIPLGVLRATAEIRKYFRSLPDNNPLKYHPQARKEDVERIKQINISE